ncbi:hypothetical protein [Streptomyces sp. NPDC004296]|uniref:hypothetical protein n=1 Tax=Streptomyces sp. NPDC004296 TaxID=3364697 RepID=UPI00367A8AF2
MLRDLTSLPRAVRGVRWDGLALAVDGPDRPPLRWETAEGRRLLLRQGLGADRGTRSPCPAPFRTLAP